MHRYRCPIGMTALVLSFLTLLLSFFPSCLTKKLAAVEQYCADKTAAFSYTCDGTGHRYCQNDAELCAAELRWLRHRVRICKLGMMLTALAVIGSAFWSWQKERAKELCLFGIASISVALSWQHVGVLAAVSIALTGFIFTVLAARLSQS